MGIVNEQKKEQEQRIRAEMERNQSRLQHATLEHKMPKPSWAPSVDNSAELAEKMKQDQSRLQNNLASQKMERDFVQAKYGTKQSFNNS